ncbi:MEDS domain-containing protein [Streptomyces sp. JB150]|uniref:MEDS domain-containing protein n=1 Tax=Streptomyces sp. JB150 TaxID=2714844 RepID=UPI001F0FD8B7|nr:MEDS domain-containing protein [Streptomyces sp. JB150]
MAVEYSSDEEWAGHLVAFVRAGLEQGEQMRYFSDATEPDRVTRTLMDRGVDAAAAVRRGQLVVATADETYLAGGRFDPDMMVGLWHEAVAAAAAQGFRGLRAIGEMSWGGRDISGVGRLLEYELRIHHEVFERLPLRAWCFYDRRLLPRDDLSVLVGAHVKRSAAGSAGHGRRGLSAAPLTGPPGFRWEGSAGYESRRVVDSAAAALAASPVRDITLDLSGLDHLDIATLARIADAARRRPTGPPVRVLGAPPALHRMLRLFPELGAGLEVAEQ